MTAREKLQLAYELAFYPPALNLLWGTIRANPTLEDPDIGEALDIAETLHGRLPETGYASQQALTRLAFYQARARAFGIPVFIRSVRKRLGRPPLTATEVPGHCVRDIGLPVFERPRTVPTVSACGRQRSSRP
jgi:hypothetical protein